MRKAYDRVECHYFEAIMNKLGLGDHFVKLVMKCVTSMRFTIKVNGDLLPYFTPNLEDSVRETPCHHIFLLCDQGLTQPLNWFGGTHIDKGIRVSVHAPWLNHLMFDDDNLIFSSAKFHSAERLNEILQIYVECSGRAVNQEKGSIFLVAILHYPFGNL